MLIEVEVSLRQDWQSLVEVKAPDHYGEQAAQKHIEKRWKALQNDACETPGLVSLDSVFVRGMGPSADEAKRLVEVSDIVALYHDCVQYSLVNKRPGYFAWDGHFTWVVLSNFVHSRQSSDMTIADMSQRYERLYHMTTALSRYNNMGRPIESLYEFLQPGWLRLDRPVSSFFADRQLPLASLPKAAADRIALAVHLLPQK